MKQRTAARRLIHTGRRGCTFVYQPSMPKLPIPELDKTCSRWLSAVTPLMSPEELQTSRAAIEDFAKSEEARQLHAELLARDKAQPDTSYINAWWTDMYLKEMRYPLPLNVNPFLQLTDDPRTNDQCVRAASLTESAMHFYRALKDQTLEPDIYHMGETATKNWFKTGVTFVPKRFAYACAYLAKSYPLDMAQYPWLFGTSRRANPGRDILYTNNNARHIAVLANNQVYRVNTLSGTGEPLPQHELERAFRWIVAQGAGRKASQTGGDLGSLTALHRDDWAAVRPALVQGFAPQLESLEGALFVLALDDEVATDAASGAAVFLHGRHNRWYDKSLQLIVAKNGRAAINFEHSWGDGVSVLRFANEICEDSHQRQIVSPSKSSAGSPPEGTLLLPFDLTGHKELQAACDRGDQWLAQQGAKLTTSELRKTEFGKNFFKAKKISPDGTVQNAIQLAYKKAFGQTVATYESASTSGFKKGRTETIRPATIESKAFVEACMKPDTTAAQRRALLQRAADVHRRLATEAATGQGCDRHLFALRRIALEKCQNDATRLPAIFRDVSYARMNHNILSTSTLTSPFLDGGGFGPVVEDGFGIGYGTTDDGIAFVATTYTGKDRMQKFLKNLDESLDEINRVLQGQ